MMTYKQYVIENKKYATEITDLVLQKNPTHELHGMDVVYNGLAFRVTNVQTKSPKGTIYNHLVHTRHGQHKYISMEKMKGTE